MSAAGMTWAFAQKDVKGNHLLTLLVIADGARSLDSIAATSHATIDEAYASVSELRAAGYIIANGPDCYQLPDHVEDQDSPRTQPGGPRRKPISTSLALAVFEADGYACVECGSGQDLTVDHIVPVSKGGTNDRENLRTLCRSCNARKGNR